MRILVLSAYHTLSHAQWLEELQSAISPTHSLVACTLPPRYFSWRLRGSPLSFAQLHPEAMAARYDAVIATSMVDGTTIRGLYPHLAACPWIVYFHENQFAYPENTATPTQGLVDRQMVQLYSALAADRCVFNSAYNQSTFLGGVRALNRKFPDATPRHLADTIAAKAEILPIPVAQLDQRSPPAAIAGPVSIVWNHRVEYDKGLTLFYDFIRELDQSGRDFRLILLGQRFRQMPKVWQRLTREFADRIAWDGFVEDRLEYLRLLAEGDVVVSTADHEFQGLAFLEAIHLGLRPLAPDRLVYPEYLTAPYLYEGGAKAMVASLEKVMTETRPPLKAAFVEAASREGSRRRWLALLEQQRPTVESDI